MFVRDKNDIFLYIYLELFPRVSFISIVLNKYLVRSTLYYHLPQQIKLWRWWKTEPSPAGDVRIISYKNWAEYWHWDTGVANKVRKINKTSLITFHPHPRTTQMEGTKNISQCKYLKRKYFRIFIYFYTKHEIWPDKF